MIDGDTVLQALTYEGLRLSILPVVRFAGRHVQFAGIPAGAVSRRIKSKLKRELETAPQWHEPVLGYYWIDAVDWDDLLGRQRGWRDGKEKGMFVVDGGGDLHRRRRTPWNREVLEMCGWRFLPENRRWDADEREWVINAIHGLAAVSGLPDLESDAWLKRRAAEHCRFGRVTLTADPD